MEDLNAKWMVNRLCGKISVPTWVQQVLDAREQALFDSSPDARCVSCISQVPLESWVAMGAKQIRVSIKHACKRFIAAQKRNFAFYSCFLKSAQRTSSESNAIHVIEPGWTFDFACFSCGKAIPYSKSPATLLLPCCRPHFFNEPLRKDAKRMPQEVF